MLKKILVVILGLGICCSEVSFAQSMQALRGIHAGGCYQQKDADYNIIYGGFAAYPIIDCPQNGNPGIPVCAPGYNLIVLSQSQANTSDGDLVSDLISLAREILNKDTYFTAWACAAN